ncbi:TPA_asm: hypothetical protein [Capsaspora MELD virus 1]|nr:TPA_asm: hypothetical protein [Capsaspora MELD virus 1]
MRHVRSGSHLGRSNYAGRRKVYIEGYGYMKAGRGSFTGVRDNTVLRKYGTRHGAGWKDGMKALGAAFFKAAKNTGSKAAEIVKNNPELVQSAKDATVKFGTEKLKSLGEAGAAKILDVVNAQKEASSGTVKEVKPSSTPTATVSAPTTGADREAKRQQILEAYRRSAPALAPLTKTPTSTPPEAKSVQSGSGAKPKAKRGGNVKYVVG